MICQKLEHWPATTLVLEDASHAIGGRYQGEPVETRHSAITVFSFHPVKIITTGEGGLATTNDPELFQRVVELMRIVRDVERFERPPADLGVRTAAARLCYRTDIQAALGISQMQRLDEIVGERNLQLNIIRLLIDLPVKLLKVLMLC